MEPKTLTFEVKQGEQVLPSVFTYKGQESVDKNLSGGIPNLSPKNTICLAIEKLSDDKLIQNLQKLASKGIRVYLLLGEEDNNKIVVDRLAGHCLIRFGVSQNGGLLIQDGNTNQTQGWVLFSGWNDYTLELNALQCQNLFKTFCYLFWEVSKSEIVAQEKSPISVKKSPVGNILLDDNYNLPEKLPEKLSLNNFQIGSDQCWSSEKLWNLKDFDNSTGRLLLQLKEKSSVPSLEKLCKSADVRLTSTPIENLLITSENGWWLPDQPSPDRVNWALRLSEEQKQELHEHVEQRFSKAEWVLQRNAQLGSLQGNIRFSDRPEKILSVVTEMSIELENVEADDIEQFINPVIEQLCADQIVFEKDRLAHVVKYTVKLDPPLLPVGAKQHHLEIQWKQQQEKWQDKLNILVSRMDELDKREGKLSEKLKTTLSGFLLGQKQKSSEIREQIANLANVDLGRSSPGILNQITQQLNDLIGHIAEREKRYAHEETRARKEIEWKEECQKLDDQIQELKKKLASKEESYRKFQLVFEEKQTELEKLGSDAGKSERKKVQKELEDSKRTADLAMSDLEKIENELSNRISRRAQLEKNPVDSNNIDKNADALGKVLGNKKADEAFKPEWPKEFLPSKRTGLYLHNQQSYLTISEIGQLVNARDDALRLKAKICVKPER